MLLKTVAKRYADAIYSMAKADKQVDDQLADLQSVEGVLDKNPDLKTALESPTVASQVKKKILKEVFTKEITPRTLHLLYVLVDKGREEYLSAIIEAYEELMRQAQGVVQCHVTAPRALTKKMQSGLEKNLKDYLGRDIELVAEVDENMLGGMVITVGDRVIDTSLDTQLLQIQERLAKVGP